MSSRHDHRRRDRSWERDERDRERERAGYRGGRRSRSRSPPRRGERDRRAPGMYPPTPCTLVSNVISVHAQIAGTTMRAIGMTIAETGEMTNETTGGKTDGEMTVTGRIMTGTGGATYHRLGEMWTETVKGRTGSGTVGLQTVALNLTPRHPLACN